jgi:hypothetical protein
VAPNKAVTDVVRDVGKTHVDVSLVKTNGVTAQGQVRSHDWACDQVEGGNWLANVQCGTTSAPTISTPVAARVQEALEGAVR